MALVYSTIRLALNDIDGTEIIICYLP